MNKLVILLSITQILGNHNETPKSEIHLQRPTGKKLFDIGKSELTHDRLYNPAKKHQILNKTVKFETYIVDGIIAEDEQFPYQVSLKDPHFKFHHCGACIISIKHLLTAAHCFCNKNKFRGPDRIMISAGLINLATNDGVDFEVERVACHPEYHQKSLLHDIGVITIRGTFQFNKKIQPIKMIIGDNDKPIKADLNVVVPGWGGNYFNGPSSDQLKYANTKTLDINICRSIFMPHRLNEFVEDWNICTLNIDNKQAPCTGDSGSPLVYEGQVLGIVSWTRTCHPNEPMVYTSVPHHYEWVSSELAKDNIHLTPMSQKFSFKKYRPRKP